MHPVKILVVSVLAAVAGFAVVGLAMNCGDEPREPLHPVGTTLTGRWQQLHVPASNYTPSEARYNMDLGEYQLEDDLTHEGKTLHFKQRPPETWVNFPLYENRRFVIDGRIRAVYEQQDSGYDWSPYLDIRLVEQAAAPNE